MIHIKNRYSGFLTFTSVAVASIWLFACQTMPGLSGVGRVVPLEKRIPLTQDSAHQGQWPSHDLTLHYRYELKGNDFTITGTIDFANSLKTGFSTLDYFFLEMVFIDETGRILASKPLLTLGYGGAIDKFTFKRSTTLLPGAVAMAFGFRGRAVDAGSGDSDSIDWYFQETPY